MYPDDKQHYTAPWSYSSSRAEVHEKLHSLLKDTASVQVQKVKPDYIHATFRIPVFGYIDDVEFYLPADVQEIHYRSASRKGRHDLGVNKRRMNKIRKNLAGRGLNLS